MLKHEYLHDTKVVTKFGKFTIDPDGKFVDFPKNHEAEMAKANNVKLIVEAPKAPAKEAEAKTEPAKRTRKPRAPRKTVAKG